MALHQLPILFTYLFIHYRLDGFKALYKNCTLKKMFTYQQSELDTIQEFNHSITLEIII